MSNYTKVNKNNNYYLKDVKWAYTLDGDFVMPFIENKEGNKIKNLLTDEIIEFEYNNEYEKFHKKCQAIKQSYELANKPDMQILTSINLISNDREKVETLIPLFTRLKYWFKSGDKTTSDVELRGQLLKEMEWHEVSKEDLQRTTNKMQYLLYRDNKKCERESKKLKQQQEKNRKIEDKQNEKMRKMEYKKKEIKAKENADKVVRKNARDNYMNF